MATKQIIKTYRCEQDWRAGRPIEFGFENRNPDYRPDFMYDYARGVMDGMRVMFAAPFVAVYDVDDAGRETLIKTWGGDRKKHL